MSGLTAVYYFFFFPPRFHWHILAGKLIKFNSWEEKCHTPPAASEPRCKAIQGNFLLCTRLCIITFNGCILSALTSFTLVFFLSPCQPNRSKAERVISREFPIKSQEVHNKLKEVLTFFIFILFFLLIGVSQLVQKSSGHQLKETPLKPFL